ncbi:DUF3168 domain-containing protein [Marinibacterium profundimaris]|uniref:Gene transfer agent protein n=1 Tax=Marinibacterium profundimaris TaxID=1679460 RepID=A0A225NRP4_9RHOB|nr:DUF3168 domain-containing protein [Marinibacterium profundimaris]OWU77515.1 gene transfer agent protein [Marinibacterium profundimaris]
MSYGMAVALQKAVYETLVTDAALTALIGLQVFDAPPPGQVPDIYVALGPEEVRDRSDKSGRGALHRFTLSVVGEGDSFAALKEVATAVSDALEGAAPALDRGHLVGLWFERARARRTGPAGRIRRIDLRFRARVEDDQPQA